MKSLLINQEFKKIFQKTQLQKIYRKCNELPIHNFNEISNNGDFDYLKINKKYFVSDIDLQNAWLEILNEFLVISKNSQTFNILNKQANIMQLEMRLRVLQSFKMCIEDKINIQNYLLEYKIKPENIDQHIGLVKNDLSKFYNEIPKGNESKKENQFEETIAVILENGYQINRFTTVVSEWVAILNRIELKHKNQKQNERH